MRGQIHIGKRHVTGQPPRAKAIRDVDDTEHPCEGAGGGIGDQRKPRSHPAGRLTGIDLDLTRFHTSYEAARPQG